MSIKGESGAPERRSKMIHRNLYKRLERLEDSAREATVPGLVLINEGTAAGLISVLGAAGSFVEPARGM
jgi:hypothetical protein